MQSGTCNQAGCVSMKPALKPPHRFECAEGVCLYEESSFATKPTGSLFKLTAQIGNRGFASEPFRSRFRDTLYGSSDRDRIVIVKENQLILKPNSQTKPTRWQTFGVGLGMTQASELTVAAILLSIWGFRQSRFIQPLATVLFTNLLTFPVVWFFFPSLQPFQYSASRVFGVVSLGIAIAFSLFLATRELVTPRTLVRTFMAWLISVPLFLALGFVVALFLGYGQYLPPSNGIPSLYTLVASEVFAVVWEAGLIYRCDRPELTVWQTTLLSLVMNGLSLLLGIWLLPAFIR